MKLMIKGRCGFMVSMSSRGILSIVVLVGS